MSRSSSNDLIAQLCNELYDNTIEEILNNKYEKSDILENLTDELKNDKIESLINNINALKVVLHYIKFIFQVFRNMKKILIRLKIYS